MNDIACCPAQARRVKWGRIICLAGALGLCVSFFMPHFVLLFVVGPSGVEGLIDTPVKLVEFVATDPFITDAFTFVFVLPFIVAILLTPLLAFRVMRRVDATKGASKFLAWADCAICLSVLITGLGWFTYLMVPGGSVLMQAQPRAYALVGVGFGALALALVAMVRSCLPRKAAAAQFALWTYYVAFFAYTATGEQIIYVGLWLSIAASGALAIGSAIDWFLCRGRAK